MEYQYIVLEFYSSDPLVEPKEHIRSKQSRADSLARDLSLRSPLGIARVEKWILPHRETDSNGNSWIVPGEQVGETVEYDSASGLVEVEVR